MTRDDKIWYKTWNGLEKLSKERFDGVNIPLVRILVGVIVLAGKDRDEDFLNSDDFLYYCKLTKLRADFIMKIYKNIWKIEGTASNDR